MDICLSAEAQAAHSPQVPNTIHLVWVGKDIPPADLLNVSHVAVRTGSPTVWTDRPSAVVRVAASLHSSKAGAIETHLPLSLDHVQLPIKSQGTNARIDSQTIRIAHVTKAFEDIGENDTFQHLNILQACEGVGRGNPARRSDIIRAAVLQREGGIYADFDRLETLRPKLSTRVHHPAIAGEIVPRFGCIVPKLSRSAGFPHVNNDLIASVPDGEDIKLYCREIAEGYRMLQRTPAWKISDYGRRNELLYHFWINRVAEDILGIPEKFQSVDAPHPLAPGKSFADQLRYPNTGNSHIDDTIGMQGTFISSGPAALQRAVLPNSRFARKFNSVTDLSKIAGRFSVEERIVNSIPARGGWKSRNDVPATSFEFP